MVAARSLSPPWMAATIWANSGPLVGIRPPVTVPAIRRAAMVDGASTAALAGEARSIAALATPRALGSRLKMVTTTLEEARSIQSPPVRGSGVDGPCMVESPLGCQRETSRSAKTSGREKVSRGEFRAARQYGPQLR